MKIKRSVYAVSLSQYTSARQSGCVGGRGDFVFIWQPRNALCMSLLRCRCNFLETESLFFIWKMAASSPTCAPDGVGDEPASEPEQETDPWMALGPFVKREPEIKLLSPISGLEPLAWSEDHRLSASTSTSISVVELVCDINVHNQDLILHRTMIPVPESVYELKVRLTRFV